MSQQDSPDPTSLPLDTRIGLTSGADFWTTRAAPGVRAVSLADGPNGVRKQEGAADHLGLNASLPATCFPPGPGMSQTWDAPLIGRVGEALAAECHELGVDVLLGPGINIKRDPRAGRNFEYFSEDPIVSGYLAAAWVKGLQSRGIGASVKHFAANNAEFGRMFMSSDLEERTLREIYLRAFERVVRDAEPWTVMAAYNRVNGVFATESRWLLTEVLRDEWGFDGVVVSDWGAVWDRVASLSAGLDLDMPANPRHVAEVADAVRDGSLGEDVVDVAARRIIALSRKASARAVPREAVDFDAHHALAREVAGKAIVLAKNDGGLLPLPPSGTVAVVGTFASSPRFQGGGSSNINPTRVDLPIDAIRAAAPDATVTFEEGSGDSSSVAAAAQAAASADVAVLFVGLADRDESEGFDRDHIDLPAEQLELIDAVLAAQPRTVIVLSHGGVVRVRPFIDRVPALLDCALLGQAGGGAIADVLFGAVNPSGRLAETVPRRLEDAGSYLTFPGEGGHVHYSEGIFVGYRWYDARAMDVEFPFGHGLSYTSFEYASAGVSVDPKVLTVAVEVTNTGPVRGREVVQVYTGHTASALVRPPRELKGFAVVELSPGESSEVTVTIPLEDMKIWHERTSTWKLEPGTYQIEVGASSRDIRTAQTIDLPGDSFHVPISLESTLAEVAMHPGGMEVMGALFGAGPSPLEDPADDAGSFGMDLQKTAVSIPLRVALDFAGGAIDHAELQRVIARANDSAREPGRG
ncbi:glycoside hydrolase family 3 C-terminal domain-containing protein [Demequina sp. NBRC 110056]|uniref:glycoside hydrolase family 3 C-terminal domain-containing protein n=1 Tax=Demequina sp. NBRC 110056 TaxID=1570345 RepID=UPI0009FF5AE4|nr:glycoside hydrolase family 3 C-terminal domain-containing protein [Demequina sp. NBRC 110056]